uniref:Phlebovirus_G2 domain-containing protein n=1 Tax=Panagrellus redivivus TaxID=6233 RepID=A0A7E4VWG0_PANRE
MVKMSLILNRHFGIGSTVRIPHVSDATNIYPNDAVDITPWVFLLIASSAKWSPKYWVDSTVSILWKINRRCSNLCDDETCISDGSCFV